MSYDYGRQVRVVIYGTVELSDTENYPRGLSVEGQIRLDMEDDPAAFMLDQLDIERIDVVDTSPPFANHPEFVPEWDVCRDAHGRPVTVNCTYGHYEGPPLTDEQLKAIYHAVDVWRLVCASEGSTQTENTIDTTEDRFNWKSANAAKSRLLGRMIHDGLPPTRTKPPLELSGPAWWLLPGGDPFRPAVERS